MREIAETKQKEKKKSNRKKLQNDLYKMKVQSDLDDQYLTLHIWIYKTRKTIVESLMIYKKY